MKIVIFTFILILSNFSLANTVNEPLHNAEAVLEAVYDAAGVSAEDVNVVVFEYNYLAGLWHVELSPVKIPCLDCFPSFYIENKKKLIVSKTMHG